jgi:hypothetical protein
MRSQKVVSLIVIKGLSCRPGTEIGLAIGFDDKGAPDSYLDPFETAQLLDEGSTIWVLDDRDHVWGIPAAKVEAIQCEDYQPATDATDVEASTAPTDGPNAHA